MMTHWLLAVGFAGMAVAIFFLGWSARIMRVEWRDDRALRAAEARYERHTHRKGDPQEMTFVPFVERPRHVPAHDPELCLRCRQWDHIDSTRLPRAGRIPLERLADPEPLPGEPPWLFAGESAPGWGSESAEYELLTQAVMCPDCHHNNSDCRCGPDPDELLTQTAEQPVSVTGEPPIDTGELMAITDRVESWIAQWTAQGNVDRHTIQAGDS